MQLPQTTHRFGLWQTSWSEADVASRARRNAPFSFGVPSGADSFLRGINATHDLDVGKVGILDWRVRHKRLGRRLVVCRENVGAGRLNYVLAGGRGSLFWGTILLLRMVPSCVMMVHVKWLLLHWLTKMLYWEVLGGWLMIRDSANYKDSDWLLGCLLTVFVTQERIIYK